ncbi:MAG: arginine N-succinyltransferase, partial [Alphaproteobacteria bacterium]|nr:arginine N-succinyltransferase [Alphaproteobacteria bacterium]
FGQVGVVQPFYSYHMSNLTQSSPELAKTFRNQLLTLTTDLEGSSEVGGLFLHPESRAGGLGSLLARSRYLFMKLHRQRFGDRTLAELRGVMDEAGNAPFWDALAGRFFDMSFPEADEFNAVHGTRFIADLMPKTPIYTAMLPESGRAVMGLPHPSGRAAMKMLEREGFHHDCYIDIFDGGPTMIAATDQIRTIRDSRALRVAAVEEEVEGPALLLAAGRGPGFRACCGPVRTDPDENATLDRRTAAMLEVAAGDAVLGMSR